MLRAYFCIIYMFAKFIVYKCCSGIHIDAISRLISSDRSSLSIYVRQKKREKNDICEKKSDHSNERRELHVCRSLARSLRWRLPSLRGRYDFTSRLTHRRRRGSLAHPREDTRKREFHRRRGARGEEHKYPLPKNILFFQRISRPRRRNIAISHRLASDQLRRS